MEAGAGEPLANTTQAPGNFGATSELIVTRTQQSGDCDEVETHRGHRAAAMFTGTQIPRGTNRASPVGPWRVATKRRCGLFFPATTHKHTMFLSHEIRSVDLGFLALSSCLNPVLLCVTGWHLGHQQAGPAQCCLRKNI
jgi:hypothetical protein